MKSNLKKSNKPQTGYHLTIDQQNIIGRVGKALLDAECTLEAADVDNTMECYGDFVTLYKEVHRALSKTYAIMHVHNMTESAERLAEDLKNHLG